MKRIASFLLLCLPLLSFGQKQLQHNSLSLEFFGGIILEHDTSLEKAIQGNPFGVLLSYNYVRPKSSDFNNLYNYPERGYSLLYENFNSDILGEVIAGYRHYNFRLNPNKKDNLKLSTGFGLAYATKTYDATENPHNFAHGSHVLVSAFFKFQYLKWLLNEKLQFNAGIGLIHFSNISYNNPNLGSNSLIASIGFKYDLKEIETDERTILEMELDEKKWSFGFIIRGGYNESKEPNSGLYPFFTLTGFAHKQINPYSSLVTGLDFSDAEFLKHYIPIYNEQEQTNYETDLTQRAGVFIGHELSMNNFAFVTQIGYTFYYPFPYISPVYERFGFKYQLSEHFLAEVTMKVNLFRAESLEFGIGYQF